MLFAYLHLFLNGFSTQYTGYTYAVQQNHKSQQR